MSIIENGVLENSSIFFQTPSLVAKSMLFYIISAGEFLCDETYHVKRSSYESFLMMYVRKGEGYLIYNDTTYEVKENDLVFLSCYQPHEYYTKTGWETQWFHFDGNHSLSFYNYIFNAMNCVMSIKNELQIPSQIDEIIQYFKSSKEICEPRLSSDIHFILSELMLLNQKKSVGNNDIAASIKKAIYFIHANYTEKISVGTVASNVQMSIYHFSRVFKLQTGYSPYEYILKLKINNAKKLLKNTDLYIKEISSACGFSSESNFILAFQKNSNMTPTQFRKMQF